MWTKALQKIIETFVRRQFDTLRLNLLGPESISAKAMVFSFEKFDPSSTLTANYLQANALNSIDPDSVDRDTINKIRTLAEHYIDAIEQKSLADTNRAISSNLDNLILQAKHEDRSIRDLLTENAGKDIMNAIKATLNENKRKLDSAVDILVNHELHNAQNAGALDGILGVAKSLNIDDPQVFKIGVLDNKRCLMNGSLIEMRGGSYKKIEELHIGDILRSHKNLDGHQDNSIKLNSVVESISHDRKECVEIVLEDDKILRCSIDHPILIYFNRVYLFWPAGDLHAGIGVEIVDIKSLKIAQKRKLTTHLNCPLAKANGFQDFWSFCLSMADNIVELYLSGISIVEICNKFNVDSKNEKYISAILKLKSAFNVNRRPSMRKNSHNREFMDKLMENNQLRLSLLKSDIEMDMKSHLSGLTIAKKYNISRVLLGKFLRQCDRNIYREWIYALKARGGKLSIKKQKSNVEQYKKTIENTKKRFMKLALLGSKPQHDLYMSLLNIGVAVNYNQSISDNIRVDMVISNSIVLEFDGSGHDMQVRMGNISAEQLRKNDYARDLICKSLGYKVIRIKSPRDKIPSSKALIALLDTVSSSHQTYFEVLDED